MSMTPHVNGVHIRSGPYLLADFDQRLAGTVAAWVPEARTLFWLAPNTPPPLTAEKVLAWHTVNAQPLMLQREKMPDLLGYVELNPMPAEPGHLWVGHCIINPTLRGCGLGRLIMELLLEDAFVNRSAHKVSLVVFPDNAAAIQCYRGVGLQTVGEQYKDFATSRQPCRMLRMSIEADSYTRQLRPSVDL